jgi:hypothetical protein
VISRRPFITGFIVGFVIALAPLATTASAQEYKAQQAGKVWRIGVLEATSPAASPQYLEAFRQGLRDHGYAEGRNVIIESRWAEGHYDRLPGLAAEE